MAFHICAHLIFIGTTLYAGIYVGILSVLKVILYLFFIEDTAYYMYTYLRTYHHQNGLSDAVCQITV